MKRFTLILTFVLISLVLLMSVAQATEHNFCVSCEFQCADGCGPNECPCDLEGVGSDAAKEACVCITDDEKADTGFIPASLDGSDAKTDEAVVDDDAEAEPVVGTDNAGEEDTDSSISPAVLGGGAGLIALIAIAIGFIMRGRNKEDNPS